MEWWSTSIILFVNASFINFPALSTDFFHLIFSQCCTTHFLSWLSQQLDLFTGQTHLLLSVLLTFNFLNLQVLHIHSDALSVLPPAPCISGACLFQNENESVKLVSMSEHVIITSPGWRWWRRQMSYKVLHSGFQWAKGWNPECISSSLTLFVACVLKLRLSEFLFPVLHVWSMSCLPYVWGCFS